MPGKRSRPSLWAHRGTLVVVTVVVLMGAWALVGAWMLFSPGPPGSGQARTSITGIGSDEVSGGTSQPWAGGAKEVADAPILWPRNARAAAPPAPSANAVPVPAPTATPTPAGTTPPPAAAPVPPPPTAAPEPTEPTPDPEPPEPVEPPPPEDDHPGNGPGPKPR